MKKRILVFLIISFAILSTGCSALSALAGATPSSDSSSATSEV